MTTTANYQASLPTETPVLNTNEGERGTIRNGTAFHPEVGWVEYEVQTQYGIERWNRNDFILMSEAQ